jgi:hypothetical protein
VATVTSLGTAAIEQTGRSARRRRVAILLLAPTARTIRWLAILAAAVAAGLALWAAKGELSRAATVPLLPFRVSAILLCLGAAFVLDDDAGATVESAPTDLLVRRGLRLLLAIPVVAMAWGTVLWIGSAAAGSGTGRSMRGPLPAWALSLEAAALLAVTLAAAAVGTRALGHGKGGTAAGPMLLVFVMCMVAIDRYWPLFVASPADSGWAMAHARWALILLAAVIVLVGASLDPARRSNVRRRVSRPKRQVPVRRATAVRIGGRPR